MNVWVRLMSLILAEAQDGDCTCDLAPGTRNGANTYYRPWAEGWARCAG